MKPVEKKNCRRDSRVSATLKFRNYRKLSAAFLKQCEVPSLFYLQKCQSLSSSEILPVDDHKTTEAATTSNTASDVIKTTEVDIDADVEIMEPNIPFIDLEKYGEKELNDCDDVEIVEPKIPLIDLHNYEEKELPESDDASQKLMCYVNQNIKQEPENEDDYFEDVGTCMISDEEISNQSSEETHTMTWLVSPLTATESVPSNTPLVQLLDNTESSTKYGNNISVDGNIGAVDELDPSTAEPVPAIPFARLKNKITINIKKNIASTKTARNMQTNFSSIPVIGGSYPITPNPRLMSPIEKPISYELKPSLQEVSLKKMQKINRGVEASGICSIM